MVRVDEVVETKYPPGDKVSTDPTVRWLPIGICSFILFWDPLGLARLKRLNIEMPLFRIDSIDWKSHIEFA